jgi:hypothetical protein
MSSRDIDPRAYKPNDVKKLFALSGNECSCPSCTNKIVARDDKSIVGKICHIEAASSDGPRYNSKQTNDERRSYDNLILLCDECHTIIDNKKNERVYSVELLKEWKKKHICKQSVSRLSQIPNSLKLIVEKIVANYDDLSNVGENLTVYNPEEKISYNAIIRNKFIIDEYNAYTSSLHKLYDELEVQGSLKKMLVLTSIRNQYLKLKGMYLANSSKPLDLIRENADNIFDDIVEFIIAQTKNDSPEMYIAAYILTVDAFVECKILEKPV